MCSRVYELEAAIQTRNPFRVPWAQVAYQCACNTKVLAEQADQV
jgi:hypothetical protein